MNNKEKQELVKRSATDLFTGFDKKIVITSVMQEILSTRRAVTDLNGSIYECMSIWAEVMREYTSLLNKVKQEVFCEDDRTLTFSVKDLTEPQKQLLSQMFATPERMDFDKETLDEINKGDIISSFKKKIDNGVFNDTPRELEKSENSICLSCKNRKSMITSGAGGKGVSRWTKCDLDGEKKDGVMSCVNHTKK